MRSGTPAANRTGELEHALGDRNLIFHNWLDHPSYDRFWQKLIPYKEQFRRVKIPVLATTGYYAGGEVGTLYYFTEHYRADPHANHTLLIGPYDDGSMQHGAPANLQGYPVDQSALLDLRELRYQWFDYIFKGADKPALLQDRVNYQVMGSNEWQHAPSVEAMGRGTLKFYLDAAAPEGDASKGDAHRLALRKASDSTFVQHNVNLADRADAALPSGGILSRSLQTRNAVVFVSDPLKHGQQLQRPVLRQARLHDQQDGRGPHSGHLRAAAQRRLPAAIRSGLRVSRQLCA